MALWQKIAGFFTRVDAPVHGVRRPRSRRCAALPRAAPADIPRLRLARGAFGILLLPRAVSRLSGAVHEHHGSALAAGSGDTPVPAVTVCRPSRGPGFPSTGRGTRQELSSAQHPQERQGRLCPPQKCQGQGGCWALSTQAPGTPKVTPPVVLPRAGTEEEVTQGRVWPADVS